ncbi:MAG: MBL fold metallo-hydrolase [Gemmatimonadetes bacterium]|nr:MBL fold metallo-hydrolase [Gemmatimonadota bacterium]MYB99223.1 MBL fold metallo-hydrolase [Gemmatimonadota bacterium]MYI46660.1 MBL fold metallo-hydrolase [Gemmatimonadota bacterium]
MMTILPRNDLSMVCFRPLLEPPAPLRYPGRQMTALQVRPGGWGCQSSGPPDPPAPTLCRMSHCSMAKPGGAQLPHSLRRIALAVLALSAFTLQAASPFESPDPAHVPFHPDTVLRVTFLDVGQGDAVLLQAPEGQTALIDAGRGDIVPLLREMGVTRIDLLLATHPHADHIGGMTGVLESIPVRFFMDNGDPHSTATYRRLLAALDARPEITYLEAVPRTISLGSATLEVLPLLPRGTAEPNDRSVTVVVRYGGFSALLSGDSEVRQLTHLAGLGVVPEVTLLKAPHHGSDNGFTWDFLRLARPRLVVISVGRNSYGHPRPAALSAYAETARETWRTDLHGHVQVLGRADGGYAVVLGDEVIAGGGRIVVHSGTGRHDGERYYMGQRRAVWNNDGDTATLYDAEGTAVVVFSY